MKPQTLDLALLDSRPIDMPGQAISASHWHLPFPVTVLVVVNVVVVVAAAVVGHSSYLCMGTSNKNFLDCWTINLQWATRRCQRAVKKHKKKRRHTHAT